jgi:hypothetical protein
VYQNNSSIDLYYKKSKFHSMNRNFQDILLYTEKE